MTIAISTKTPVELPQLPFAENALDPVISANTLSFHYGKHHKAYVDNTLKLIAGSELEGKSLEEIVAAANEEGKTGLFNNAAQAWNHDFYWTSMAAAGSVAISAEMKSLLEANFGTLDDFKKQFTTAAVGQFGSGWAWLVLDNVKLAIVTTSNAGVPWLDGKKPLFTVDVWEHAYYLDYQNRRQAYVEAVLDKLINWDFALQNAKA
ncbi:MAG TPA: superoxide dismutase [Fe] [Anaerolineaceae bacterium]|nr:superoxide dismutase [Fe] [Anaerolineaceae bacterium]